MTGFALHLLGTALLGFGLHRRPLRRAGTIFLVWWIGLLTARVITALLAGYVFSEELGTGPAALLGIIEWAGTLILVWALASLSLLERPRTRRLRVFAWIAAAAFLVTPLLKSLVFVAPLLALPFFWSFRWRAGRSAGMLALAGLTGFVTILLGVVNWGQSPASWRTVLPTLVPAVRWGATVSALYSLGMVPAVAGRIHLSIRRIRMRLLGSHVLAGFVPFALAVLFLLLAGALFLSTYRGAVGARWLLDASEQASGAIARALASSGQVPDAPFGDASSGQTVLVRHDHEPPIVTAGSLPFPPDSLLDRGEPVSEIPLVWDGRRLLLRARFDGFSGGLPVRVEALAPVDSLRMRRITRILGTAVRVSPQVQVRRTSAGIEIGVGEPSRQDGEADTSAAGLATIRSIGPPSPGRQLPGGAIVECLRWTSSGFSRTLIPVSSSAAFGEQIVALFPEVRRNPLATVALVGLGLIAVLFLGAIGITISMVYDMGRSITRTVWALTAATDALRQGRLDHRIAVEGNDELWNVAGSFNEMAESLQKMRAMEREAQRLEEELRLARVIQDRLLPSAPPVLERTELAGVSLPAREVGGDYFDYLIADGGLLGIAVADVSGKGAPAALLMSTFRASLRSQDLAALGPAEALGRVNRFIHSSVDPGKFITAFLGLLDPRTGEFRYANAGHDAPIAITPDGRCSELTGGGLILGLLPQIVYEEGRIMLEPGSLISIFTDGITEARDGSGDFFGPERLTQVLRTNRALSCDALLRCVVDGIHEFTGSGPQGDDITILLARWR